MILLFVLSDVHAEKQLMQPFLDSSEKFCLQLGDFGFIWKYNDWKWNKFLNNFEKNYPKKIIITILGNHENYDSIEKMPIIFQYGAKMRKIRKNVFAIERGEILFIENKTILCIGGANSTDKEWRIEYENSFNEKIWWAQEEITPRDIENAFHNINKSGMPDIVLSHCTPAWFKYQFYNWPSDTSEKLIGDLERHLTYSMWYCGHIHEYHVSTGLCGGTVKSLGIGEYEII